jgi:HPt (histidine-containing phosphotransfer) domain-containing protein
MPARPPEEVLQQASVSMLLGLSDVRVTANLVSEFIDDTRARIPMLRAAVQTEDRAEIGRIAHGIKGACWSLGLAALGDALQRIDVASRDPEQGVTLADMDAIEDEVERATDAMRWLLAVCAERAAEQR